MSIMPKDLEIRQDIGWKKSLQWGVGTWIGAFAATKAFESITSSTTSILSNTYGYICPKETFMEKTCEAVSPSNIYNLAITHPYISTPIGIAIVGGLAWKYPAGVSKISKQAYGTLKQGIEYVGNILKYNKRELAITIGLAGATYYHIGSNLAIFILSSIGAAFIAGDNKDKQKALTASNRHIKKLSVDAIKEGAVKKQFSEKDIEFQRLTTENDRLKQGIQSLEGQIEEVKKLVEVEEVIRKLLQNRQVDDRLAGNRGPCSTASGNASKDAQIRDVISKLPLNEQDALRSFQNMPSEIRRRFKNDCYSALDADKLTEFLKNIANKIIQDNAAAGQRG